MPEPVLLRETRDGVTTLILNRPDKMNALSRELRNALTEAFRELADDDSDVVILTGAGRAFCAGLDLKELGGETGDADDTERRNAVAGADIVGAMQACPKPIIGAINGVAITGGFEVALACDLVIASSEARFADTHARVGILPGWGLSQRLSRTIGIYRAKELSLTGNFLDAATAAAWGLVNRVVARDELLPTCEQLARDMASCPPRVLRRYKRLIDDGFATNYGAALDLERRASAQHIASVTAEDIAGRRQAIQERGRSQS
jgi:enoyl-CoA hydratase